MRANRPVVAFFLILAALFFIANRGAYKGYFQDDDFDNLSFTREISLHDFWRPMLYPRVYTNNFRPVGHYFYRLMGQTAGLNYPLYIAALHLIHFANCILLWLVLRRLGAPRFGAAAGTLFFAFHLAAFDVYWKPMYLFDLFCGLFCLIAILAYLNGHVIVSLLAMFVAYRSKEIAIMLPVVFAAYELTLGEKRWKRLIPFFTLSVIIGVQAIVQNRERPESDYSLHLDPAHVWTCIQFYAGRLFLIPYLGLAVLLLLALKDRRVTFGISAFCALLVPMLLLPGRLFSPYLYVPLIGLSVAAAFLATRRRAAIAAVLFIVWLSWNYVQLRRYRSTVLAGARDRQTFTRELTDFNHYNPAILNYIYNTAPVNFYGTRALIRIAHPVGTPIRFATLEDDELPQVLASDSLAVIAWDAKIHQLRTLVRTPRTADAAYIKMSEQTPIWQLEQGWYGFEGTFRWTKPDATARLARPPGARQFSLLANISPQYIETLHRSQVEVSLNGTSLGPRDFTHAGWQEVTWELPAAPPGPVEVKIHVSPAYPGDRLLGLAVGGFGFAGANN